MADMKRLWAPWRLDYVQVPDKQDGGCFLCRAASCEDDHSCLVLRRSGTALALLNRWPYNNGHLLIAPAAHKADLADLTEDELSDQMGLLKWCQAGLMEALSPDGFNVGLNLGRAAGAGVIDHMHWHVVPRWQGDVNFMTALAATKVIPQSLEQLWNLLREVGGQQPQ